MIPANRWLQAAGVLLLTLQVSAQSTAAKIAASRQAMVAGTAAAQAGKLDEAKRQFKRAVGLTPTIAEGHAALGSVLLSLTELPEATRELTLAHQLAPANGEIVLNLAAAEAAERNESEAVKHYKEATVATPAPQFSAADWLSFGVAFSAIGDATAAESTLRSGLEMFPTSPELHDALGAVLAQRGALDEALDHLRQAVTLNPRFLRGQYHLGVALLVANQPRAAEAPLSLVAAAEPRDFDAQLQYGRALSSLHEDALALHALHLAADLRTAATPKDATSALALALQASGDPASALPLFEAVLKAAGEDSATLTNFALARVQTGDARGALPLYARALALGPDLPTLREDYGAAYLQQSDLDHAIEQFQAGLEIEPNNAHLHYDLGLAFKLKDDLAKAIAEFHLAAQLDPALPDPAYTLGVIYMQQARYGDAAAQLKQVIALQPQNGDAWALLGNVLKETGDAAGSENALTHAIALEPDQPSLHIQLAALEVQRGDKEAAATDRKIAADLSRAAASRQRAAFALKSAHSLLADGKLEQAVTQLTIAAQAEPTLPEPHRLLSQAYTRMGRVADAALELRTAKALDPQQ